MSQKDVCMDIKTEQFEVLEEDKARLVDGGADTTSRHNDSSILGGLYQIIDFFRGK